MMVVVVLRQGPLLYGPLRRHGIDNVDNDDDDDDEPDVLADAVIVVTFIIILR